MTDTAQTARAQVIEDIEFMLSNREHPAVIATRLGYSAATIARRLSKAGRCDLAGPFHQEAKGVGVYATRAPRGKR